MNAVLSETPPTMPGLMKRWLVAVRPFSLPASTTPVIFGTVLAVTQSEAHLNWPLFIIAFIAMVALHSAANLLSDVHDYRKGLDTVPLPVSGAIVRGILTSEQVQRGAVVLFALGTVMGLALVVRVGWPLLYIGLIGLFIGVFYTARPVALKYRALGDLAVFFDFGILCALGASTVQTGQPSLLPVLWTIPIAMLVVGILHANNWRDMASDKAAEVRTMAGLLGDQGALYYYGVLVFGAYGVVLGLMALHFLAPHSPLGMPPSFALVFLSVPLARRLWYKALHRAAPAQPFDFIALDGATAQLNLIFGLLCSVAAILHAVVPKL
jgi:1,4-dihydroxy-2-naphthoate polyprenyltransferase